jgi:hypothetical protein
MADRYSIGEGGHDEPELILIVDHVSTMIVARSSKMALAHVETLVQLANRGAAIPESAEQSEAKWLEKHHAALESVGADLTFQTGPTPEFKRWFETYPGHRRWSEKRCQRIFPGVLQTIADEMRTDLGVALEHLIAVTRTYAESDKGKGDFCWTAITFLDDGHWRDKRDSWNDQKPKQTGSHDPARPVDADHF